MDVGLDVRLRVIRALDAALDAEDMFIRDVSTATTEWGADIGGLRVLIDGRAANRGEADERVRYVEGLITDVIGRGPYLVEYKWELNEDRALFTWRGQYPWTPWRSNEEPAP